MVQAMNHATVVMSLDSYTEKNVLKNAQMVHGER
jgi:hypothetical protein